MNRQTGQPARVTVERDGIPLHQRLLALAFVACALVVLAGGSILVCWLLIVSQPRTYDAATQQVEAAGIAVGFVWPATIIAVWLLGTAALVIARRPDKTLGFLLICLACMVGGLIVPLTHQATFPLGSLPVRGIAAMIIPLLFAGLNGGAIYGAWRYVVGNNHSRMPAPAPY